MADVVVVGAGIVGASVAYHAARAGAAVTLLDRSPPASGVTGDSFAWIGGPAGADVPDGSAPLRRAVLADYRRLEAELPRFEVRWTGSVGWGDGAPAAEAELGPDERIVDAAQVAALEPALRNPPTRALHRTSDGAVDPVRVTEALVQGARDRGAEARVGVVVTAMRVQGGRVVGVETSTGPVAAGTVVLAAGVDAPRLCAPLGFDLPVAPSPALLLRIDAPPGLVRTLVNCPQLEVREASDGHLLVAAAYDGEAGADDVTRVAQEGLRLLRTVLAADRGAVRLTSARVGMRPMPADGLPIIGPVPGAPGAYLAVMHAGVTLAPVVGRLVAAEVVDGLDVDELRALRPARFLGRADVTGTEID